MRKFCLSTALFLFLFSNVFSQPIGNLFQQRNNLSKDYHRVAGKYQSLKLNPEILLSIKQQSASSLQLRLPFENKLLGLELKKVKITADNFSVIEALPGGGRRQVNYPGAIFYQGKIEGMPHSFATISIVDDQVFGIIADDKSNIVLGAIENNGRATQEYTMYREPDLKVSNPLNCFTSDEAVDGPPANRTNSTARVDVVGQPVDIYFECDYKFYQDKGSNTTNVINYVLSFFNNTSLLYSNENIKIQVSQILVWTTQDPEAAAGLNTSSGCLTSFSNRMLTTSYIGDYAHFLSTRSLGGGVAWLLSNPCGSTPYNRCAVSAIYNTYSNFPTYSWTVEVVTHELGHNLGSHHTHWCGWPGGPIDWCAPTANPAYIEGTCTTGPLPPAGVGGTIMSYCHLISVGINFNNGFGPLPGDAIRTVVTNASCFGTCKMTITIAETDASCGQNNGSATVTATSGTGTITYIWSNGQTGPTLANAAPGTFNVKVNDAAGCQVMDVVTIGNSGTSLALTLTPGGTAGFCTGGNLTLTATNNPSYTYVWKKDGNVIGGATTNTYLVTISGTYSVTATSGACSATQSVVVTEAPVPVAGITAGGPTTFCEGNNVVLNGNAGSAYTYQWYKNGATISGATSPTYTASASGNYTVKVSAGGTCAVTSSAVAVIVNPSPAATITAGSVTSFCAGGNVIFTASSSTGYSYQWYQNGTLITGANQSTYTAAASGNYTVTTTLGSCSKTSAASNVVVLTNPSITISPSTITIEKYHTQVLTAGGATSYNWNLQPALVTAGTNTATFEPLTTTSYAIEGTDVHGCKGAANATINVIGCGDVTGISATAYSPSRVIVHWTNPLGSTADTLQYRKPGSTMWTKILVTGQEYEINGLTPGTDYEYIVVSLCSTTNVFVPSALQTFKTPALNGRDYVRLYPNPVNGIARIEVISESTFTLAVTIFDNSGKKVMIVSSPQTFTAGQVIKQINGAGLPDGIYHLAVNLNGKTQDIKMVVTH
jgi:hypothetical protein